MKKFRWLILIAVLVVCLLLWTQMLEAVLDQQKRQTALLRRLCESNEPEKEVAAPAPVVEEEGKDDEFIRLVAER